MEQAVFISKTEDMRHATQKYTRLYYGIEFCERLAPSREDLDRLLGFAAERGLDFTLVTPFLTDGGLKHYQMLVGHMLEKRPHSEIVVNDWGLLAWISRTYAAVNLALGRLLTKQKRGPRILHLAGKVPGVMIDHFRRCGADSSVFAGFLKEHKIKRIELDNLLQGIRRTPDSLPGSLYVPYAYVTTTRLCLAHAREDSVQTHSRAISPCHTECRRYAFRLQHKQMPVDLYLKGNTQFFVNERLPGNLAGLNIDRIVYQPEIPL